MNAPELAEMLGPAQRRAAMLTAEQAKADKGDLRIRGFGGTAPRFGGGVCCFTDTRGIAGRRAHQYHAEAAGRLLPGQHTQQGLKASAPPSPGSRRRKGSRSSPSMSRSRLARDRTRSIAAPNSAPQKGRRLSSSPSSIGSAAGLPSSPSHGRESALHHRGAWCRRRPVHAASVCRAGREGACGDLGAQEGRFKAAKGAWTVLSNPRLDETRAAAKASIVAPADANAKRLAPILREVEAAGAMSLRQIAAALAARGIPAVTRAGRCSPQDGCEPELSLALACSPWRVLPSPPRPAPSWASWRVAWRTAGVRY